MEKSKLNSGVYRLPVFSQSCMMWAMTVAPIASLREHYLQSREQIREQFFARQDPDRVLSALTNELDELIQQVADQSLAGHSVCVLATGGYGRRELYPHSDVDLLFVYQSSQVQESELAIKQVLHDLWDLKLNLGHQVWSLEALETRSLIQFELSLALLDARIRAGERALGEELLSRIFPDFLRSRGGELAQKIVAMTRERHARYRNTIYQLEPDIKEAPGGLRDHLVGRWLFHLQSGQLFLPYSEIEVREGEKFLKKLRLALHFLTGRNQNQLTHHLQEQVCPLIGYSGTNTRSGVESLMSAYFLNARILHGFCRKSLQAHEAPSAVEEIDVPRESIDDLGGILEIFRDALRGNYPLSDRTRTAIVKALPEVAKSATFATVRGLIQEIFKPQPGLYRVLSEMYELGVLELLFPEFGTVKARLIRDFYHKYTVDEHSLLAIKNIENLLTTEDATERRFRSLLEETRNSELLTLALLLHDVGKSREGKHTERSARMAAKALKRFHFPKDEPATIVFLIRNHLAMSQVIFKRDLEDKRVIRRFVDLIRDTDHLRLLCLLTFADIKAVAPGTLNEWKKDLLWQLYVAAYQELTLGYGEERIEEEDVSDKLLAGLPEEFDPQDFESFLEGFPRRYLASTPASEIHQHYRLASRLNPENPIQLRLTNRKSHYELCVVASDRYFLFAKIVGILSYFDMNILRGYGFANRQNTVLDFFQFTDTRDVFHLNPVEKERLQHLLVEAVQDRTSVEKLLEGKEKSPVFQFSAPRFEPTLYFADEHSEDYSIVEIVAPDSIGLLYRIGREIAALRCNIELVLISTEGGKAVDVFYLTHNGKKLAEPLEQELTKRIIGAIG